MISYVPSIRLRPWTFWFATDASPEHRGAAAAATPETVFRRTSRDTHRRRSARRLRPGLKATRKPTLISFSTTYGTVATRFSSVQTSRGTPILSDMRFAG